MTFYTALGYREASEVRNAWSSGGTGLTSQPMKKVLGGPAAVLRRDDG